MINMKDQKVQKYIKQMLNMKDQKVQKYKADVLYNEQWTIIGNPILLKGEGQGQEGGELRITSQFLREEMVDCSKKPKNVQ